MHIALRTEYSFKACYMPLERVVDYVVDGVVGVADDNNTYAHVPLARLAEKHGFKPLFGVRLYVVPDENYKGRNHNAQTVFIAKNQDGLRELYSLVSTAWDQFYYFPRIFQRDSREVSDDIVKIEPQEVWSRYGVGAGRIRVEDNFYPSADDKAVYQLMCGAHKRGDGYVYKFNTTANPQTIDTGRAPQRVGLATRAVAQGIEAITIPKAEMVVAAKGHSIERLCKQGAKRIGIVLETGPYRDRLEYELKLIHDKGYADYFLIVADIVRQAKRKMLVGPARGSSAGSLVCYLLGITEIDPIEHGLVFERFIDINRHDLPDIDVDFPDRSRADVIKFMKDKYGADHVAGMANINKFAPRVAIAEFAKALNIPPWETEAVKDAIVERKAGDSRANVLIKDTFDTTEAGRAFIEDYPEMRITERIEGHASHAGKHAAGVIVSTLPLENYAPINHRDGVMMLDKHTADHLGLLKIDILGLKTLSVIEDCLDMIGMTRQELYDLEPNDPQVIALISSGKLAGIFQFEGQALQEICKRITLKSFEDIAAVTALARPGALQSGGTSKFINIHNGNSEPKYYNDIHKEITEETLGIVVYQEQMMRIAKDIGGMSWSEVSALRKAASKSLGDEFFNKYKAAFLTGAKENGLDNKSSNDLWHDISSSGNWSFNKSHAVGYGVVSYWTAYLKTYHPLQFACATLNHSSDDVVRRRFLRQAVNEGIEYTPVDTMRSGVQWSVEGGQLLGGLTNIIGVGEAKAKDLIRCRSGKKQFTTGLINIMNNPRTGFDILFPAQHLWSKVYSDWMRLGIEQPHYISQIKEPGVYTFIGCLLKKQVRDLNELVFLEKRDGERIEDHTLYLNLTVEDDTDMIPCSIGRWDFQKMGIEIANTGEVGVDWYIIRGKLSDPRWRRIQCQQIIRLNEQLLE